MREVEGTDGELIDRLVDAIKSAASDDWRDVAFFVVFAIGGEELDRIVPEFGEPPKPGTMGAKILETHTPASRDEYFELIRRRILGLVNSGVREDFLVRALRDELTAQLQEFARTEAADTRREETRTHLETLAADPQQIADFRARLADTDPDAANASDEEIAKRLRELAALMGPMSPADVRKAWDRVTIWNGAAEAVSNDVLATWARIVSTRAVHRFRGR